MPEEKKTEEQIRHEIRRKFNFSEEKDTERIDKAVEMEKDRFKAVQKKVELKKQIESGKPVGKQDPEGTKEPVGDESTLSVKDSAVLLENKIPTDDWDEVVEYAKFKGIDVKEAINNPVVKSTLKEKAEERASAGAVNTKNKKRGGSKTDGDKIWAKASKGQWPEKDEEVQAVVDAQFEAKKKKA